MNIQLQLKAAQATVHSEHKKAVCVAIPNTNPQRFKVQTSVRTRHIEIIATGETVFSAWINAAAKINQKRCLGQRA